jgi:hypothetical protein
MMQCCQNNRRWKNLRYYRLFQVHVKSVPRSKNRDVRKSLNVAVRNNPIQNICDSNIYLEMICVGNCHLVGVKRQVNSYLVILHLRSGVQVSCP